MTLNLTYAMGDIVTQVSDRRMANLDTREVIDDEANKAVIVACDDALVAITFTGIGEFRHTRMDDWLLESMGDAGVAELGVEKLVDHIEDAASALFQGFPKDWVMEQVFTIAGWQWEAGQPFPRLWLVSNCKRKNEGVSVGRNFSRETPKFGDRLNMTGAFEAVDRQVRKRAIAALRRARSSDEVEDALVQCIRDAALRPMSGDMIGESCLAVTVSSAREARAKHYANSPTATTAGPHLLWYAAGRSIMIKDPEIDPRGAGSVSFGREPANFVLEIVDSGDAIDETEPQENAQIRGVIRTKPAIHRTSDSIDETVALPIGWNWREANDETG